MTTYEYSEEEDDEDDSNKDSSEEEDDDDADDSKKDSEEEDDDDADDSKKDSEEDDDDAVDSKKVGGLDIKTSELFGLIFFALLKKKYFEGAKQLIETGSVRIHHLLVGCVILQDIANDWQTSQIEKDKLLQMKMLCTQKALRITSCIHENDTKVYKKRYKEGNDTDSNAKELGKRIDHAGRLLLNHGYLADAIKTENSVYLNDDIVKKVINQMWYKRESLSLRRGLLFAILTLLHFILLPSLMITMENKPLQRLYRLYKVPVMKVLLNMVGWLAILVAYSYMLLFDFTGGVSRTHWFIIAWMSSLFIDEVKQIVIAVIRKKFNAYITDWTNYLEWGLMIVYVCGMLFKLGDGKPYRQAEKVLLVLSFILICVRFLNLLIISEIIGAKLVIIRKMFMDTFAFLMIITVITYCYSVSYFAILYTDDSDLSFTQIEKIARNGFWILFGELSLESDRLKEPDCTFNKEMYDSGEMERCPSELGLFLAPYLKAVYALIAIILLLNLLIAMYSHTFEEVHEKSKFYWSQLQLDFLEEYSVKTIFPIHFQLLVLPVSLVHFMIWFPFFFVRKKIQKCICGDDGGDSDSELDDDFYFDVDDDELNKSPMFVRVFLYDKNFDLNLKDTNEAEGQAALKASGDLDTNDEDKITVLQRKMKRHKKLTRSIDGRTSKIMSEVMQIKKNIRDLHQAISPKTMPQENERSESRAFNDTWGAESSDIDTDKEVDDDSSMPGSDFDQDDSDSDHSFGSEADSHDNQDTDSTLFDLVSDLRLIRDPDFWTDVVKD
ncbi:transient receptor potential cation channel subfamily M member 2-like [Saccostrea cucullata]|uniref:transient receptor potential cation channel subfamily M member 2-like n=1 Tax=Saccostrea cuccullata TaxID=36930 RepID=UPI002ED0937F